MQIVQSKANALQFLYETFEKKKTIICPYCHCKDYYTMSKGYLRCIKCKTDYNPLQGTWIYEVRIDAAKWIALIKLFEIGTSARRASIETGISYPTALATFDYMCYAILYNLMKMDKTIKGKFEMDES